MSKQSAVEFHRELDALFERRTSWLCKAVDKGIKSRPKVFDKNRRKQAIEHLQDLATDALANDMAKKEFNKIVDEKKQWQSSRGKGWSRDEKQEHFNDWFQKHIPFKNCIYIFWKKSYSEYVGRTLKGKGRPQSHFDKFWFNGTKRIDIYSTSLASEVPKLECLAIHRFRPKQNGAKASIPKWAKKCPVCEVHKLIREELNKIFALR
ncbi:hypothetical protein MUP77_25970 [Candidatus Bathyarchaeota archaeon]|nr:hypothetical protein [Candidatus Bathyarchaeota archaeon]